MRTVDLTGEVEFFKGELEHTGNEVMSQGIQVGFKVFL